MEIVKKTYSRLLIGSVLSIILMTQTPVASTRQELSFHRGCPGITCVGMNFGNLLVLSLHRRLPHGVPIVTFRSCPGKTKPPEGLHLPAAS